MDIAVEGPLIEDESVELDDWRKVGEGKAGSMVALEFVAQITMFALNCKWKHVNKSLQSKMKRLGLWT